ncbi:putative MATE family efflux protein [Herbihabitans rhizosphaerae]|uniref:Putative MATE family efflux protein n=1 Tax=Herbihabitans rhizosphaerae TaxID=1872711 RepID=A0A4Q7KCF9_9PSEU|nr:MATE family efflux transporter [Herbihabitans rhizosphaerae]RZS30524.1 putative MATE family efflux protein [Herbihabitans rhizosphaerae]
MPDTPERTQARRFVRLALPALGVLAAEPLYLLVDTAVVGHLGAIPLAGLSVGAIVLAQISTNLTFLSYGTTARAARLHGAGRTRDAVAEGVQATWLALAVGTVLLVAGQIFAEPIARLLSGDAVVARAAVDWLRVALLGVPFILVTMAGNGWMRGVQDGVRPLRFVLAGNGISAILCPILVHVVHMGLVGSAIANVIAQVISASLFLRALAVERVPLRPQWTLMRAQLGVGRDLVVRSLAFQISALSATAVAAHTSTHAVGAHQIVLQLWIFIALVLDAIAIAAQSLVGEALGAHDERRAHALARQVAWYGLVFGTALGVVFGALASVIPGLFTTDGGVLAEIPNAWWFFVVLQPIGGVVFALDGVLLGAGDSKFMRNVTIAGVIGGYLPLIWASLAFGWGLVGIWTGLALSIVIRLVGMVARTRSGRWAVVGAVRA